MARSRTATPTISLVWRSGIAHAIWWEGGVKHSKTLRTRDPETAKRALAEFRAASLTKPSSRAAPVLIRDLMAHYLADREGRVAAFVTLQHASTALNRHMGDLAPGSITRGVCRDYARRRRSEGRGGIKGDGRTISNGTIIRELVTLRAALRMALRDKLIADEPYIEVPETPRGRERWMTRDEAARLLAVVTEPHVRLFVILGLHTAARTGAILELRWSAVDFVGGVVDFGEGVGNKRRSRVPMTATLRAELVRAHGLRRGDAVIEWRGASVASVRHAIRLATARAGIEGVTAHIFRHTAISWMVQRRVPLADVARFVGDSEKMIEKRYGHYSPDFLAGAAAALEG